jgi:hypothetical protein
LLLRLSSFTTALAVSPFVITDWMRPEQPKFLFRARAVAWSGIGVRSPPG